MAKIELINGGANGIGRAYAAAFRQLGHGMQEIVIDLNDAKHIPI